MANTRGTAAVLTLSVLVLLINASSGAGTTAFGSDCKTTDECKTDGAVCETQNNKLICTCDAYSVHVIDGDKCLANVTIDMPCEVSEQCKKNYPNEDVECREDNKNKKVCLCIKGKHFFEGKCYKSVAVGEACANNEECFWVENMECTEKKCACKDGYSYNDDEKECSAAMRLTSILSVVLICLITRIGM